MVTKPTHRVKITMQDGVRQLPLSTLRESSFYCNYNANPFAEHMLFILVLNINSIARPLKMSNTNSQSECTNIFLLINYLDLS